jgi:hypothetical protein
VKLTQGLAAWHKHIAVYNLQLVSGLLETAQFQDGFTGHWNMG